MSKNKIVVYTAIMGDFDGLKSPEFVTPGVDYICFTDMKGVQSNIWKIVSVTNDFKNPRMKARQIKLNPHFFVGNYEYSIWIDGNIILKKDLGTLLESLLVDKKVKIATFKHFSRDCLYDEALECVITKKDTVKNIYKQIEECINNGYPTRNGLAETNVMFRMHNDGEVINLMTDWWRCVSTNTIRDQLSFNYVLYKHKIVCEYFEGNTRISSEYFGCELHKNDRINHMLKIVIGFFKKYFKNSI